MYFMVLNITKSHSSIENLDNYSLEPQNVLATTLQRLTKVQNHSDFNIILHNYYFLLQ
jgi:hypothetical protein